MNKYTDEFFQIHELFSKLNKYNYTNINDVPFKNGIYAVYEDGEVFFDMDRIVYIGDHSTDDRLITRIKCHYQPNKDGSILRKKIGTAILNKNNDDYVDAWKKDTSKSENKIFKDEARQKSIELEVTEYIKENLYFVPIYIEDKLVRASIKSKIIATLCSYAGIVQSSNWLGNYIDNEEVFDTGQWSSQNKDADELTSADIELLMHLIATRQAI